jgi:hypothetical protein
MSPSPLSIPLSSEYTGQITDTDKEGDMNTSAPAMPGRVAIEVIQAAESANFNEMSDGWISYQSLAEQLGRDTQDIIVLVAKSRIPSFRHAETLEEGLDRQGVNQLFAAWFQSVYSNLKFEGTNSAQDSVEMPQTPQSAPLAEGKAANASTNGATGEPSPSLENPVSAKPIELKLPLDWHPKNNPQGGTFARNPNPSTALDNALLSVGIVPKSDAYWEAIERFQRRRMDDEARDFIQDIANLYSERKQAFNKLREQACKLWDAHTGVEVKAKKEETAALV